MPAARPTATELLKHPFLRKARNKDHLKNTLLNNLSALPITPEDPSLVVDALDSLLALVQLHDDEGPQRILEFQPNGETRIFEQHEGETINPARRVPC